MSEVLLGYPFDRRAFRSNNRVVKVTPRNHLITVGSARSGKGVSSIIPNLLTWPGSLICYDPKLENTFIAAEHRARIGQRVIILDPFGELQRIYLQRQPNPRFPIEWVTSFNPMLEIDPRADDYEATLTEIADAMIDRGTGQGRDPHWDERSLDLNIGLKADCIETGFPSLIALRHRLMLDHASFLVLVERAKVRERYLTHGGKSAYYYLASFTENNREMQSIFSTARRHTKFLDDRAMARHFEGETNSFRISDLASQRVSLFLGLPPDKLDAYYPRWVRVLLIMLVTAIIRARPRDRVAFFIDEFATALGRIPIIERQFGLGAGLGLILWPYVQSLSQLRGVYGEGFETFLGNAAVKQFFGCGDQFTAEYVSRLLGAYRKPTVQRSFSANGESTSVGETWEQVMRPEEVRRFLTRHSIAFVDEIPHRLRPIKYYEEPFFAGRFRTPPEYTQAPAAQAAEAAAPSRAGPRQGFHIAE